MFALKRFDCIIFIQYHLAVNNELIKFQCKSIQNLKFINKQFG